MVVKMKAIKAKPVSPGPIQEAMAQGMRDGGEILKAAAERVTSTWSNPPKFTVNVALGKSAAKGIQATVTTDDPRWLWTDKGTKPHIIRARNAPRLAFPSVFTPKSKPNSLKASAGSSGGPTVYAMEVHHPGTEARNFSRTIHARYHSDFKKAVQNAIAKWRRK
jgi:hypothetical protein